MAEPYAVLRRRLTAEPARPDVIRRWPGAPWLVVATVCVGAFMGQLDASIVTLAIPAIRGDFHASLGAVEWVALSYLLVLVATVTAVGRLADMFGRKLFYLYGFVVFTGASLACALAPTLGWLIVARLVQGLGAALLQANSVALIRTNLPRAQLGRAIGLQGAAQATGLALGPALGGALIALGGWRWIFYVNVPAGVIGLVLGWLLLPRTRARARRARFDWPGAAVLLAAVTGLLWAFSRASTVGFLSPQVWAPLGLTALLVAVFRRTERRAAAPVIDLGLFADRGFSAALSSGLVCYLLLFGALFVCPLYLQAAHHLPPERAGLVLAVLPITLALAAPLAGLTVDRLGPRRPAVTGMITAAAGFAIIGLGPGTVPSLAVGLGIVGLGVGAFVPANNTAIAGAGRTEQAGMVSGVLNMTRGVGTSLGVAVTGSLYALVAGLTSGAGTGSAAQAGAGLRAAMALLAALAVIAALISGLGGQRPARTSARAAQRSRP